MLPDSASALSPLSSQYTVGARLLCGSVELLILWICHRSCNLGRYYGGRALDDARRGIAPEVFQATPVEEVLNVYRVSRVIDS